MLVRVLHPFKGYIQNQIIDTAVEGFDASGLLEDRHVEIVYNSQKIIDSVSDNLTYNGEAFSGALTSDEVWTIKKILTVGTVTSIKTFHDVSWDNRNLL